jgi:hypothetical protein
MVKIIIGMIQLMELVHVEHPLAPVENLVDILLASSTLGIYMLELEMISSRHSVSNGSRTYW